MYDLVFCFAGIAAGLAAGFVPGLHVNNWLPFLALLPLADVQLVYFVVALSMAYVFASFFPAILLGAPEEGTSLAVLPGHSLVMRGDAYTALVLSLLGGLLGLFLSAAFLPVFAAFLPPLYSHLRFLVVPLLVAVVVMLARKGWKAAAIVALSSCLGLLTFRYGLLLPLLTGFFGLPSLALAAGGVPPQVAAFRPLLGRLAMARAAFVGCFASSFLSTLPGVSSSIAASAARVFGRPGKREFLVLLGSINCSYMVFSFFTLFLLGSMRSGSAAFISRFPGMQLAFVYGVALFAGVIAAMLCLGLARRAVGLYRRADFRKLRFAAGCFLVAVNFLLGGWFGLLVLLTAASLGIAAQLLRVDRTACMAALIVPAAAALL